MRTKLLCFAVLAMVPLLIPAISPAQEPSIVVHAAPPVPAAAPASAIDLTGPDTAKSGDTVTVYLTGTPPLDLAQPLTAQLDWLMGENAMSASLAVPGQPLAPLDVEGTIVFAASGATMRPQVHFLAGAAGEYRVLVDWNYRTNQLAEHVITVKGGQPDPTPDPPVPDPPAPVPNDAKWQVMFFLESTDVDDLPAGQIELLSSLTFRQSLDAAGHRFMGRYDRNSVMESRSTCDGKTCRPSFTVKSDLAPWWEAVKGDPLPRLAIAPIDGGDIRDFPLPADEAAFYKLLEGQQ